MGSLAAGVAGRPAEVQGSDAKGGRHELADRILVRITRLMIGISLLWVPIWLTSPLARDQGIFAWVGTVILSGGMPYVDAWEQKGPFAHYTYALAFWLFGTGEHAPLMLDLLFWAAGMAATWRIAALFGGGILCPLASIMMVAALKADYWSFAQPDVWVGLAMVGMLALLVPRDACRLAYAAAGLLIGCAVMLKPHYALMGSVVVAAAIAHGRPWRQGVLDVLASVAGVVAVVAAAIAYFAQAGALDAFIDVHVLFNLRDHLLKHDRSMLNILVRIANDFVGPFGLFRTSLIGVGLYLLHARFGRQVLPVGVAIVAAYLVGAAQLKWYEYHLMPFHLLAAVPMACAFVAAVTELVKPINVQRQRAAIVGCVGFAAVAGAGTLFMAIDAVFSWGRIIGVLAPVNMRHCMDDFCHAQASDAARFIRQSTKPGEPIYVWGFEALIYVLADRPSASRYGFNYPLLVSNPQAAQAGEQTLMRELAQRPPAAIVVQDKDANNLYPVSSREQLERFPALRDLLASEYQEARANPRFTVYLRR